MLYGQSDHDLQGLSILGYFMQSAIESQCTVCKIKQE